MWIRVFGAITGGSEESRAIVELSAEVMVSIYRTEEQAIEAEAAFGGVALETTPESFAKMYKRYNPKESMLGMGISATEDDNRGETGVPQDYLHVGVVAPSFTWVSDEESGAPEHVTYSPEDDKWLKDLFKSTGIAYSL